MNTVPDYRFVYHFKGIQSRFIKKGMTIQYNNNKNKDNGNLSVILNCCFDVLITTLFCQQYIDTVLTSKLQCCFINNIATAFRRLNYNAVSSAI